MKYYDIYKLIKSEDLNHHGTLFAGRLAEWFVESCFITASNEYNHPENLVCLKIHELKFTKPISKGSIIKIQSKIVKAGTTSINVYGKVTKNNSDEILVDGFVTFVCVDKEGKKMLHNLKIEESKTQEDIEILKKFDHMR